MQQPARPPATPVRISPDLRAWLKHQSIDNRRTLGNEIVFRLEQSRQQQVTPLQRPQQLEQQ